MARAGCSIRYDQLSPHCSATLDVLGLGQLPLQLITGNRSSATRTVGVDGGQGQPVYWGVQVDALCDALQVPVAFHRMLVLISLFPKVKPTDRAAANKKIRRLADTSQDCIRLERLQFVVPYHHSGGERGPDSFAPMH